MAEPIVYNVTDDLVDRLIGLAPGAKTYEVRHFREKVAAATQGSYDALFDPQLPGLSLAERLLVALYATRITPSPLLAAHYRARLTDAGATPADIAVAESGKPSDAATPRLAAILEFTRKLIEKPVEGDEAALKTLPAAGVSTPAVVTLSQLIAFLSYQVRLVAGLQAMKDLEGQPERAAGTPPAPFPANTAATAPGALIKAHGFTNESLEWKAWLDVVNVDTATPEQVAVLEESHPKAKVSDYYLFLVHQPEILRQRSTAFNAIMYAPGGLSRAERELGSTYVSRVNGCVYCASVHAQRFEQLAKRNDVIAQVFEDPATAGTTARELAIGKFSIQITEAPAAVNADSIQALKDAGLNEGEILDLLHSDAIFAWANRLMLNLGEPVFPAA
ncbi:CMD domain protein [Achromobacter insolitus]|jgi:CMD domain protein|uniref:CMD domain protein n=1 Tax=Achromobacter insolitus TaxID=217204 RepID=UPI0011EB3565|nr:CMD domain protein [Achromobacter insolitus]MCP1402833.1 CMD domain protein [Achromobacter insolitus]QEK92685.1 CMD domain protein [Achromobacter insolitus]